MATPGAGVWGFDRWKGRVALVTGASSGMGYMIAKQLTEIGMKVVGCARNTAKIEALAAELSSASGKLFSIKCDMSQEEDILRMFQTIKEQHGGVDVCVNNAGMSLVASILEGKTSDWRYMFEVNVLGPCICIREAVKQMKERKVDDGHIILINSVIGHKIPTARQSHFYSLTKHSITTLTEIVRQELKEDDLGIKVTSISPGLTRTEFHGRMFKVEDIEKSKQDYDQRCKDPLEPEDIAQSVVFVLSTPPRLQVHELTCRSVHQLH